MLDSTAEILEKISLGEDSTVEFKVNVTKRNRNNFADEVAAFANARGGVILIGVDDNGDIVGIAPQHINSCEKLVAEVCQDSIKPSVSIFTEKLIIADRALLKVEIPRGLFVYKSPGGYFIRRASSKREMEPAYLAWLYQSRSRAGLISFDEQPVPNTNFDTLNRKFYMPVFIRNFDDDSSIEQALLKRHLLVRDSGSIRASVSGILMCHARPDEFIPGSYITAVYYKGHERDANYQIDAKEIRGPLNQQIDETFQFVERNNIRQATKNIGREDMYQYSMRAVFEAIVNSVIHRDYSKSASKIRLFMFADRLEIYSPGELLNTLTVEDLPYNQVTRNELLSRLLSEVTLKNHLGAQTRRRYYLERRGEGVGIILRESTKLSGKEPVYTVHNEELCLTIFSAT